MLDAIRSFGQNGAILLLGLSVGAAWIIAIVAPNTSYDHLKDQDADEHVRELIKAASDPIAVMLLVAGGLAILGGLLVSGIASLIAAFGFFINRWTLARAGTKSKDPAEKNAGKTRRILAVSSTLLFSLVAAAAAGMAVFGI